MFLGDVSLRKIIHDSKVILQKISENDFIPLLSLVLIVEMIYIQTLLYLSEGQEL